MQIIGHRGAAGLAPENTIAGIKFALNCRVDWVEFDVHATSDGKIVVLHDATIDRVVHGRGKVSDYTHDQLKAIATKSGEPIPTFEEVMQAIGTRAKIDIEVKSVGCAPVITTYIHKQVTNGRPLNDFLVSSFKAKHLREVHTLGPQIPLALLHDIWPFKFLTTTLPLVAVGFYYLNMPQLAIQMAHKRKLWVYAYTVNTQTEADALAKRKVDALVTDVPQNFRPYLSKTKMIVAIVTVLLTVALIAFLLS